jgi:hypothetical protein
MSSPSRRTLVVGAIAAVVLVVLFIASFSAYSQQDLNEPTNNWFALLSPALAATVPAFVAIVLHDVARARTWRLIVGGALLSAIYFTIPFYVGLRASATDLQITMAASFISWLATAAGLAGALFSAIVLGINGAFANRSENQRRSRILQAIRREAQAASGTATAIELGPLAYEAITRDWGDDAHTVLVSSVDGSFIGLASERWPAQISVPAVELPIVHAGSGEDVHIRTERST